MMTDKKELTAPCGLDCFNCELYEKNLTDNLAGLIHDKLGVPEDQIACKGCRRQDGARCVAHRSMEVGNREAIPSCRIRSLAQAMDRRKDIRLDQSQSSFGARLRTLCHDRHGLHPPCHDPHYAKATCCKRLVMTPIFSDGLFRVGYLKWKYT